MKQSRKRNLTIYDEEVRTFDYLPVPHNVARLMAYPNDMTSDALDSRLSVLSAPLLLNIQDTLVIVFRRQLQWRHNEHDSVSNHQPHDCLLKRLFRQIKENIKAPRHWPLCGEFNGGRGFPRTNGQWRVKCFHLMTSSCNGAAGKGFNNLCYIRVYILDMIENANISQSLLQ